MKRMIITLTAFAFIALALCACASPQKMAQDIIKQQTGQNVEINNDGSTVTVKGENGESAKYSVGNDLKWPADKLQGLPELKGSVKGVIETGGGYYVTIDNVNQADARAYIQKLKDMGYGDGTELNDGENHSLMFTGAKGEAEVFFQCDTESGTVTLGYGFKKDS